MSHDNTAHHSPAPIERTVVFTDAVIAIAMTLLALELPVPSGDSARELLDSATEHRPEYVAFLISFFVIASAWSQHHFFFRYVAYSDQHLRSLNTLWLLTVVLTPFATKILISSTPSTHAVSFGSYAVLQVLAAGVFLFMVRRVTTAGLSSPDAPPTIAEETTRRSVTLIVGFALSIPLFTVIGFAWICWIITPVLAGPIVRRWDRHRPAAKSD